VNDRFGEGGLEEENDGEEHTLRGVDVPLEVEEEGGISEAQAMMLAEPFQDTTSSTW